MDAPEGLFGSSVLPAEIEIGQRRVALGEIVRRAQIANGTEEEWNELAPLERDLWLISVVHCMRAEAEAAPTFDA